MIKRKNTPAATTARTLREVPRASLERVTGGLTGIGNVAVIDYRWTSPYVTSVG